VLSNFNLNQLFLLFQNSQFLRGCILLCSKSLFRYQGKNRKTQITAEKQVILDALREMTKVGSNWRTAKKISLKHWMNFFTHPNKPCFSRMGKT
jgi:hypothetical protein